MPKASKSAKAAPKPAAKKAVARKGAKKAAGKAAPKPAPQVDQSEKARSDRQIKSGPYAAIQKMRKSGKTAAQLMQDAQHSR